MFLDFLKYILTETDYFVALKGPNVSIQRKAGKIVYLHTDYLPDDVQRRLLQKHAFESHSQRAYFVVGNNKLNEYKGLTLPYSDEIVPASGQPLGLLLKKHGEREARVLNDIARREGNVKAEPMQLKDFRTIYPNIQIQIPSKIIKVYMMGVIQ
jgi:hypothetical protein